MGLIRTPRRDRRARLQVEKLEDRLAPAGLAPSALSQLLLEQLNDARANPAAYGQSIGLDLSAVAPSQPLAWDTRLIAGAQGHSQDMSDRNYFSHVDSSGLNPGQRMAAQGYAYNGWGESIAAGYTSASDALKGLIIDDGIPDLGHRRHLLAIDATYQSHTQAGIGIVMNGAGAYSDYYTIDTAAPIAGGHFLTGAVYSDLNGNGKYDIGEGLGGVTITVAGVGATTSFSSGGYTIQVGPGTYTVTASGGGLATPFTQTITMGAINQRLEIIQGAGNSQAPVTPVLPVTPVTPVLPPPSATSGVQHDADVAVVNQLFAAYVKRSPSSAESAALAALLDQGQASAASLTSMIKGSQEYQNVCTVWLRQTYHDMLGRDIDANEIGAYVRYLSGAGSMDVVANAIANSQEHHVRVWTGWVQDTYQTYLHRSADAGEIGNWISVFQAGWTKDNLVAVVLSSGEYQSRAGVTSTQFVTALYQDMLGRTAGGGEVASWVGLLDSGAARATIVADFLGSFEYHWRQNSLWSAQLYSTCLGRPANASEVNALAAALNAGASYDAITAGILESQEYYLRAHG